MKVAVIDYDIGNVRSILNILERVGAQPVLTKDEDMILEADALILPGVGAFKQGIDNLKKYALDEIICQYIRTGKPFLGICLGMQVLFEKSFENGEHAGLGLIEGSVDKVDCDDEFVLPHMGWNSTDVRRPNKLITEKFQSLDFYFVHSYKVNTKDEYVASYSKYKTEFVSSVRLDNIYGVQFHPEKSGNNGVELIRNFVTSI